MTAKLPFVQGAYVPRADEKFRRWAFVFTQRIARDPAAAGLSQQVADELVAAFAVFNEAYVKSRMPSERTAMVVSRKNAARHVLEGMCRSYAQRIRHNDDVSYDFKSAVFRRGKVRRKKTGPPVTQPTLFVVGMNSGRHVLRWSDDSVPWSRRKPAGAVGLQLFAVVDKRAVMDFSRLQYVDSFSKQPMKVTWGPEVAGMTITYIARWINAKFEHGPWSAPVPIQVAFAGPVLLEIDRAQQVGEMHSYRKAA